MADTSKITLGQLKTALTQAKNYTDNEIAGVTGISKVEPEALDMPKVFFYGNALPTTKDNVNLTMDYVSNTDKFTSYVKLKCQGTSSMSYAKKNFTVSMFSDESRNTKLKKDFKGWGAQSKFCLKANYVDTTHTRNLSGARIAYDMVNSRPDSPFKQQLLQCPRNGAVDGFPIKLYFNGEFYGIYTWNIPKDGWMFNMNESNPNHIVLCAERNTDGNASLSNSCQFKKLWTDGDGGDWSVEFGTYSTDLQTKFNRVIAFVKDSTDEEFKANISQYLDLYSVIDYYCFSYLCCHLDGLAKNMLMVTYDGNIWGCSLYDMDSIFGVHWNGNSYVATNYQCPEQYQEQFSLLWPKIERCFGNELYQRYLELRRGALSLSNIIKHVEEIYDVIPDRVFADEKAKWTSLPQVNTNTMTRFRNYMRDRAAYVDAQMREIGSVVSCTGIVLNNDTLTIDASTSTTATLTAVVAPEGCTDTITWSVSPIGIVTVNNGTVRAVANGTATITATCGNYSDTCSVTVSGVNSGGGADISQLSNVISYYDASTLNPGDTTWTDSVNGHTLTIKNGATVGDGILSFDGVDDYAEGSLDLSSYTTLTLALDIRNSVRTGNNVETYATIGHMSNSSGAVPIIKYENIINSYSTGIASSNVSKTTAPTDFDRAIVVRDGTNIKLYINGELIVNTTFNPYVDNYRLLVGANYFINAYCDFSNFSTSKVIVMGSAATDDEITIIDNMLSESSPESSLVYELPQETTFNGTSDYIDTGVALLSTDQDFTIVLDVTASASQTNSQATILHCMHEAVPYPGLSLMTAPGTNGFYIPGGNNASIIGASPSILIPENMRTKVVITKEGTALNAYNSNGFAGSSTYTYSQVNENLLIGAYQTTNGDKGRYFVGTIYDFKIYNKAFTSQEKDAYLDMGTGGRVFKIDSSCMNTASNALIDSVAGISATLTGNPTVSDNQIVFDTSDTFSFDISSLNLANSNRTFRIKFTPNNLDTTLKNVIEVGSNNYWNNMTSVYIANEKLILQHGDNSFSNITVGNTLSGYDANRLLSAPVNNQEYELVISENIDGNVRWFIDGTLVQDGITTLFDPSYLSNTEGNNRFTGKYSLIEIYNAYCNDYTEFTNMVNNASSDGGSDVNANYLANASWQVGTLDMSNPNTSGSVDTGSTTDRYTSVQIPAGKYALRSANATWKKFRLSDSNGNVLYYHKGENITYDLIIDTTISDDTIFTLEVSYYKPNDTIEVPSLITTDRTNIATLVLDGSLDYSIPEWISNVSGQNGQVNVEYHMSNFESAPMCYKLEGYTFNSRLSDVAAVGLAKQYNLGVWQGSIYLRFTLDMAETGVTNDVESITNYLSNNPLTFKYVM